MGINFWLFGTKTFNIFNINFIIILIINLDPRILLSYAAKVENRKKNADAEYSLLS